MANVGYFPTGFLSWECDVSRALFERVCALVDLQIQCSKFMNYVTDVPIRGCVVCIALTVLAHSMMLSLIEDVSLDPST